MEKQTVGPLEISEANSMFYYGEILSTWKFPTTGTYQKELAIDG